MKEVTDNSWRKACVKESFMTFVITLAICLVLNFIMQKTPLTGLQLASSLPMAAFITPLVIIVIQLFAKKAAVAKGAVPNVPPNAAQASYALAPNSIPVFIVFYTVLSGSIGLAVSGFFAVVLPQAIIPVGVIVVVSAVTTALAGFFAAYHCAVFLTAKYRESAR